MPKVTVERLFRDVEQLYDFLGALRITAEQSATALKSTPENARYWSGKAAAYQTAQTAVAHTIEDMRDAARNA